MFPLVQQLRRYYDFSLDIGMMFSIFPTCIKFNVLSCLETNKQKHTEKVVPKILSQLCSGSMSPTQHLEKQQALVKQFAEILEFVLKFDEHKVIPY